MSWHTTQDVEEYLAEAGAFLRSRPAEHTLLLTVTESVRVSGRDVFGSSAPVFGWWREDGRGGDGAGGSGGGRASGESRGGQVAGAFLQTPPYPVLLTRLAGPTLAPLAEALYEQRGSLPGVSAPAGVAEAFAAAWYRLSGEALTPHQRQRLYRLAGLVPPHPAPPGAPRAARPEDRELVLAWFHAFSAETDHPAGATVSRTVDERIAYGGITLWEVDGQPVSLVSGSPLLAGMVRIGPVYTPPQARGRGYAAAATAEVSRAALAAGADEVLLFTDLANPTSNALYQRIGYRPVEDRSLLTVSTRAAPPATGPAAGPATAAPAAQAQPDGGAGSVSPAR